MTRVAGANPRIWVDIFLDNAAELAEALAEHRRRVEQLEQALAAETGLLARWIAEASENRRRMLAEAYPDPGELQQGRPSTCPTGPGARRDHAGARRRADQHRGLRAPALLARARRRADDAGLRGRRSGAGAALLEAQGYGVSVSPVLE
jgi:hypothetical protein